MKTALVVRTVTCKQCGHSWLPRKLDVFRCPRCQSIRWQQPKVTAAR